MRDVVRGYLRAAAELTTGAAAGLRRRAEDLAAVAVSRPEELPAQLQGVAAEAVALGVQNGELLVGLVRSEVEKAWHRVGDGVVQLGVVLELLERQVRQLQGESERPAAAEEHPTAEEPAAQARPVRVRLDEEPVEDGGPGTAAEDDAAARRRAAVPGMRKRAAAAAAGTSRDGHQDAPAPAEPEAGAVPRKRAPRTAGSAGSAGSTPAKRTAAPRKRAAGGAAATGASPAGKKPAAASGAGAAVRASRKRAQSGEAGPSTGSAPRKPRKQGAADAAAGESTVEGAEKTPRKRAARGPSGEAGPAAAPRKRAAGAAGRTDGPRGRGGAAAGAGENG